MNAFVSGGLVPAHRRGLRLEGLGAVWDWYATFADLAGVSKDDPVAAAARLPAVDGVSLWPYLAGDVQASPRTVLPIGSTTCNDGWVGLWCYGVCDWMGMTDSNGNAKSYYHAHAPPANTRTKHMIKQSNNQLRQPFTKRKLIN